MLNRLNMWLVPGMKVKRWLMLFTICTVAWAIGFLHFTWTGPLHFMATDWILRLNNLSQLHIMPIHSAGLIVMLLALFGAFSAIIMLNRSILHGIGHVPAKAVGTIYQRQSLAKGPQLVALGGGTGLSNLLSGIKQYSSRITAVVTVADDGGSSGKLRQALDMVAPGDLTDCYAALSDSPVLARMLLHRFARGEGIEGHTLGNLMLATLSEERGGIEMAIADIHEALKIRGQVFPATTAPATLVTRLSDGRTIVGESQLASQVGPSRIEQVELQPQHLPVLPAVTNSLYEADMIILGPGSLYTSIIPTFLAADTAKAIRNSSAPLVYVASIMTESGETDGYTLQDHIEAIVKHLGRLPDHILVNNAPVDADIVSKYQEEGAEVLQVHCENPDIQSRLRFYSLTKSGSAHHDPEALSLALLNLLD